MVNRWCWPVQVRVLVGEQRGPAAVVEHLEQPAGHHDPAGRARQRVGLDGAAGHDDDASAGGHAGGPPVGFGQRAGAGADHHRDRHRGAVSSRAAAIPARTGTGSPLAEHRLRVIPQRGQDRDPGERRGGHQGQRGRAERRRARPWSRSAARSPGAAPAAPPAAGRPPPPAPEPAAADRRARSSRLVLVVAEQLAQQPRRRGRTTRTRTGSAPPRDPCPPAGPGSSGWRPGWRRRPAGRRRLARFARAPAGPWRAAGTRSSPPCCRTGPPAGGRQPLAHLARAQRGARRPQHVHHFRLERAGRAPGRPGPSLRPFPAPSRSLRFYKVS